MKTVYEVIWSIIGVMLIVWFIVTCHYTAQNMHDGVITPVHHKQTIEEFLRDHPDIKQRVDELKRQAAEESKWEQS